MDAKPRQIGLCSRTHSIPADENLFLILIFSLCNVCITSDKPQRFNHKMERRTIAHDSYELGLGRDLIPVSLLGSTAM